MKTSSSPTRGRARHWLLFVAVPGVLILLALGAWQTQRLFWKNEINEFRAAQTAADPVPLPAALEPFDAWHYRPVYVEGRFRHDDETYLAARSFKRQVGVQVITPFETTDGRVVLINRGWVPDARKEPRKRRKGQVEGLVRIEGLVVAGQTDSWIKPDNLPDKNTWFWLDLPTLSAKLGMPEQTFLIDAGDAENPGGFPIGGQTRLILRNEHLQYALIWYLLAAGLAGITYLMRRGALRRAQRAGADGDNGASEG